MSNPHYYEKLLRTKLKDPVVRRVNGVDQTFVYKPPRRIKLIDTHSTNVPTKSEPYSWDITPVTTFGKWSVDAEGEKILVADPEGTVMMPVNQIDQLEGTLIAVASKSLAAVQKGEPPPYDAIIIDEWGEFMDRCYSEILPTALSKKGAEDGRKAFGMTNEWIQKVVNWMKQLTACGVSVCLVTHDKDPDYDVKGTLRKGGPKAPSAGIANKIVGMCDGAIQRYMKDPPPGAKGPDGKPPKSQRLWRATATEQWNIGLRGLDVEDEDLISEMELYDILVEYCGFTL